LNALFLTKVREKKRSLCTPLRTNQGGMAGATIDPKTF
jgi:hypothetical protein